jgi:hypothetical protein
MYSRYAIGEILLVVIGILLALQINNWNENRINNEKLKNYLTDIVIDLKRDTDNAIRELEIVKTRNETRKSFLALKDYNSLSIDSLEKSLETFYGQVEFNKASFNKIENSGITDFGQYDTLIEGVRTYYYDLIPRVEGQLAARGRAVELEDNFWRYTQNSYEFTYDEELASAQSKDESKEQLIRLLQSPTPRNILKIDYRRNKNLINMYNFIIKINNALIEEIEKALNK